MTPCSEMKRHNESDIRHRLGPPESLEKSREQDLLCSRLLYVRHARINLGFIKGKQFRAGGAKKGFRDGGIW